MRRLLITVLSVAALSACGFHPRARLNLPDTLGPVTVQSADKYSPLGLELASALTRAGAMAPVSGQPTALLKITADKCAIAGSRKRPAGICCSPRKTDTGGPIACGPSDPSATCG